MFIGLNHKLHQEGNNSEPLTARRSVKPVSFSEMKRPKSSFQYAALVGSQAKNVSECAEVFDQCPFDRVTIMHAFIATK